MGVARLGCGFCVMEALPLLFHTDHVPVLLHSLMSLPCGGDAAVVHAEATGLAWATEAPRLPAVLL